MKQGLIGVIVPVYKVEKYIAECIESILAQTYTNFRLILVDDGSPDNAGLICDKYAKIDSRITVIHQENAGVTRARARGVEEAEDCEFITFVDGDDTLPKTSLQELYNTMSVDCDIVLTDKVLDYPPIKANNITSNKFQELLLGENISSAPWGKLFRRNLFNNFTFDIPKEIVMGEDLIMNLRISEGCKRNIGIIHNHIYNYNIHPNNTSYNFKDSAEHEYLFYSNIIDISTKYSHQIIYKSLKKWNRLFGYSYNTPAWFGTNIHKVLIEDIKKYKYKINCIEYALLIIANPTIRFVIICIKKCKNKIQDIINVLTK